MNILVRLSIRYFSMHLWQTILSVLGVALGCGVVVAIDLAITSARAAFERSTVAVTGKATHHIVGAVGGFPDTVYTRLRIHANIRPSAPIVDGKATILREYKTLTRSSALLGHAVETSYIVSIVGVDIFSESDFRPYLRYRYDARNFELAPFLSRDNMGILSAATAQELGVRQGDTLLIEYAGIRHTVEVCGIVTPQDEPSKRALERVLICDIGTAQKIVQMQGKLSRIDLILPSDEERELQAMERIRQFLPDGLEIMRSTARPKRVADMTRAFELNLTALSLLALIVGMFIIYNTMTFAVVQRRDILSILRVVGATRRKVFAIVLAEACAIGCVGTVLGICLGIMLGSSLVRLVSQAINDLYFTVAVTAVEMPIILFAKSSILGIVCSVVAALVPAREAMKVSPNLALHRSSVEEKHVSRRVRYAVGGLVCLLLSVGSIMLPSRSVHWGYVSVVPMILGYVLFVPLVVSGITHGIAFFGRQWIGTIAVLAIRDVSRSLSRTGVAIAALMVALAAAIGVGIMVQSFRMTVEEWLTYTLNADVYISPPSLVARRNETAIEPRLLQQISSL
ncbi:MAG: ABC transporter permease, partial [Bacteroidota bacterium]|nr:ABC transporter permease [Candidatus Kapabacteria bacterium]MDW8220156.1 ABC transporter permease [Bacteroidota bacterium]